MSHGRRWKRDNLNYVWCLEKVRGFCWPKGSILGTPCISVVITDGIRLFVFSNLVANKRRLIKDWTPGSLMVVMASVNDNGRCYCGESWHDCRYIYLSFKIAKAVLGRRFRLTSTTTFRSQKIQDELYPLCDSHTSKTTIVTNEKR